VDKRRGAGWDPRALLTGPAPDMLVNHKEEGREKVPSYGEAPALTLAGDAFLPTALLSYTRPLRKGKVVSGDGPIKDSVLLENVLCVHAYGPPTRLSITRDILRSYPPRAT
jgi:hypothetical protein